LACVLQPRELPLQGCALNAQELRKFDLRALQHSLDGKAAQAVENGRRVGLRNRLRIRRKRLIPEAAQGLRNNLRNGLIGRLRAGHEGQFRPWPRNRLRRCAEARLRGSLCPNCFGSRGGLGFLCAHHRGRPRFVDPDARRSESARDRKGQAATAFQEDDGQNGQELRDTVRIYNEPEALKFRGHTTASALATRVLVMPSSFKPLSA
jgi:hypothetical protein